MNAGAVVSISTTLIDPLVTSVVVNSTGSVLPVTIPFNVAVLSVVVRGVVDPAVDVDGILINNFPRIYGLSEVISLGFIGAPFARYASVTVPVILIVPADPVSLK